MSTGMTRLRRVLGVWAATPCRLDAQTTINPHSRERVERGRVDTSRLRGGVGCCRSEILCSPCWRAAGDDAGKQTGRRGDEERGRKGDTARARPATQAVTNRRPWIADCGLRIGRSGRCVEVTGFLLKKQDSARCEYRLTKMGGDGESRQIPNIRCLPLTKWNTPRDAELCGKSANLDRCAPVLRFERGDLRSRRPRPIRSRKRLALRARVGGHRFHGSTRMKTLPQPQRQVGRADRQGETRIFFWPPGVRTKRES